MSIMGWIILGLIAGFSGSKIVNKTGQGFLWTSSSVLSEHLSEASFAAFSARAGSPVSIFTAWWLL